MRMIWVLFVFEDHTLLGRGSENQAGRSINSVFAYDWQGSQVEALTSGR